MIILNYTPHKIQLIGENGYGVAVFPSNGVARCSAETEVVAETPYRLTKTVLGEVNGLPEPREGIYLIVSRLVADKAKERKDLLCPNELVRDADGNVVGCKSFCILNG